MKITKEQLEKAILIDKLKYKQIAEQFNMSIATVNWYIDKYDIPRPYKSKEYPSKGDLQKLYFDERKPIAEILQTYNIGKTTLKRMFDEYGLEFRPSGTNQNHAWTYDEVKRIFEENGCELLESEYKNANTPLKYRCLCGNVAKIRFSCFQKGQRCSQCKSQKVAEKKRLSFNQVKKVFDERGVELLSTEYKGGKDKLKYICPKCGEVAYMTFCNFKRGYGCANCKKVQFSGANNPNYNSALTDYDRKGLGRYEESYKAFRRSVFARDKKCIVCGSTKNEIVHHLDGYSNNPDKRTDVNNAVTLCEKCHKEFHSLYGYGRNTKEQFDNFLKMKEMEVKRYVIKI